MHPQCEKVHVLVPLGMQVSFPKALFKFPQNAPKPNEYQRPPGVPLA